MVPPGGTVKNEGSEDMGNAATQEEKLRTLDVIF
jgi:hypothetical protein